jgi:hypothetical protein
MSQKIQYTGIVYKNNNTNKYYFVSTELTKGPDMGPCGDGCYNSIELDTGILLPIHPLDLNAQYTMVIGDEAKQQLVNFSNTSFNMKKGMFGSSKIINPEEFKIIVKDDGTTTSGLCSKKRFYIKDTAFPVCNENYVSPTGGRKTRRRGGRKSRRRGGRKSRRRGGRKSKK